jgi:hypothetical protein
MHIFWDYYYKRWFVETRYNTVAFETYEEAMIYVNAEAQCRSLLSN